VDALGYREEARNPGRYGPSRVVGRVTVRRSSEEEKEGPGSNPSYYDTGDGWREAVGQFWKQKRAAAAANQIGRSSLAHKALAIINLM
jgi:hypothetical protein